MLEYVKTPDSARLYFSRMLAGEGELRIPEPISVVVPSNRDEVTKALLEYQAPSVRHAYHDFSIERGVLEELRTKLGESPIDNVYADAMEEALLMLDYAGAVGSDRITDVSSRLFLRMPADEARTTVFREKELGSIIDFLTGNDPVPIRTRVNFDIMYQQLQKALESASADFVVEPSEKADPIFVDQQNKVVYVNPDINEPLSFGPLAVRHEILGHYTRRKNGSRQPDQVKALLMYGMPGYELLEEGVAVGLETMGDFPINRKRVIYARFLAAGLALKGANTQQVMSTLESVAFSREEAAGITRRIFRGGNGRNGVCVKDAIYYEGLKRVTEYARSQLLRAGVSLTENPFAQAYQRKLLDGIFVGKVAKPEKEIGGVKLLKPIY